MIPTKIHNIFSGRKGQSRGHLTGRVRCDGITRPSASCIPSKKEAFQTLFKGTGIKIERIVSRGQATPQNKWLREKTAEWVIILRGRARLSFKKARKTFELRAGDYVFIPARTDHRVEWTRPKQKTVWLAVHFASRK